MRRNILLAMFTLAFPLAGQAFDGADTNSFPVDTVHSKTKQLQEVTVTSRRGDDAVTSTSPRVVLDAEGMKTAGITGIGDALNRMPGINLRDYGGAGGLKTVSVRGFGAAHTGVVYDGIPLSDCQTGQIDLSRYTLDNVASLALTIGDNADIFIPARAASTAASLEINTFGLKTGKNGTHADMRLRLGSFGMVNPFAKVRRTIGKVTAEASAEFTHADNDYPFTLHNVDLTTRERRNNSRMNSGHGEINLAWSPATGQHFSAKGYYYDNYRRLPGQVIYYNNVNHERLREKNGFAQVRWRGRLSGVVSMTASAKYNHATSLYHDEGGAYPGGELNQNYWQKEWYATSSVLLAPSATTSLCYSADVIRNSMTSNLPTVYDPTRTGILQSFTGKVNVSRFTAMARLLWSIYLNGATGAEAARNARRLSPSLSLSWQPFSQKNFFVRVSYKDIFRVPSFSEAYFDHFGSAELLPETTRQYNLGTTWESSGPGALSWLRVTADGYYNQIKDKILAVPYNMFKWRMTNIGKVLAVGMDATLSAVVDLGGAQSLRLDVGYSYQRAMPRTDRNSDEWNKQVAYTPRNSGSGSLAWENPWVNVTLHTTGTSARYTTNLNIPATRINGYMEFGLTLLRNFTLGKGNLEVRGDVLNIADKTYEIIANYPMPGRSWQFTVGYSF